MTKIIIKHLGPISEFSMEIKQFNLLIGEQATGKSTICKAIYFFQTIKEELIKYLYNTAVDGIQKEKFPKSINTVCKSTFIDLFGYSWDLPNDLNLQYIYKKDISIMVSLKKKINGKKYINIKFSEIFKNKILELEHEVISYHDNTRSIDNISSFISTERLRLHQEIIKKINILLDDELETYYIPAGRSLLTLMTNQKTKLDYQTIDLVNRKFMQFIENIQPKFDAGIAQLHKYFPEEQRKFDVTKMSSEIINNLKGEYTFSKSAEYLKIPKSNEKIPINFISSGQQEVLWLLNQLYVLLLRNEKSFIIIEEPEAHLYPTLQKSVLEFIIQFMNITGSTIILTTHSPYILTCTNNFVYSGHLKINKKIDIDRCMGKFSYISPQKINACKLSKKDGITKCEQLVNSEQDEILTELIDDVSDEVNRLYTELFYLEKKNENSEKT